MNSDVFVVLSCVQTEYPEDEICREDAVHIGKLQFPEGENGIQLGSGKRDEYREGNCSVPGDVLHGPIPERPEQVELHGDHNVVEGRCHSSPNEIPHKTSRREAGIPDGDKSNEIYNAPDHIGQVDYPESSCDIC